MSAQSRQILSAIIASLERGQQRTDDKKEQQRLAKLIAHAQGLERSDAEWGADPSDSEEPLTQHGNGAGG